MVSILPPQNRKAAERSSDVDTGEVALAVLDSLVDAVYVLDRDWRIIFANQGFVRHMNIARTELIGQTIWAAVSPSQQDRLREGLGRVMRTGIPEAFVQDSVVYPGRTVDVRVFPVFDGLAVVFRDVTRRANAERALATSEAHLRLALDGAAMGDWAWNAEADVMTLSERALALYGLGPEAQGMALDALRRLIMHPDDLPAMRVAAGQAYADQKHYDVDFRVHHGDGWRWMRVMGGPHIVNERVVGVHGLVQDIDDRKRANERLTAEIEEREKSQQRQELLIHELNHRVKNILAMVQAIAAQTLSTAPSPEAARASLEARLIALAQAHDVLTRESWDGAELMDIVSGAVAPYEGRPVRRFRTDGPRVRLEPKTAVSLALALHELATNAVKYGALSNDEGWVEIGWTVQPVAAGVDLRLSWVEQGGPPVRPPKRKGFGTRLIARSLGSEQGKAELSYPEEGARCEITVVLPAL
jgi:PAS domain S-box-containing protein